MSYFIKKM